jgi:2,4-diketo-3-deoxy-L-fuconate hydrolase
MRLCRFERDGRIEGGFYHDDRVVPFPDAGDDPNLTAFLPGGSKFEQAKEWAGNDTLPSVPMTKVKLLVPNPRPNKLLLLAGNYAKHIEECGGAAVERAETFPYVFMKPPSTTLNHPGAPVIIPRNSPDRIDWELELGVVIGRGGKHIAEADALDHVAGYTIFNDISNRGFRPNPDRKERPRDPHFDWLHGKWHDASCPSGPCIVSSHAVPDPQNLAMQLRVNGELKQDANTAQQIFPVAAVIEFISGIMTLEPGDMISTGTAAGVGHAAKTWLKPGDHIEAMIESIGTLVSPVAAE